jgi:hypothetical protein
MDPRGVNFVALAKEVYDIMKAAPVIEDPEINFVTENPSAKMGDFEKIMLERFAKPLYCGEKESESSNNVSVACMYFVKLTMKPK